MYFNYFHLKIFYKNTLSERRCLKINTPNADPITDTQEMALALLKETDFTVGNATDYGCAGRGSFNAFSVTEGKQVDDVDKMFYAWKKCVQCAAEDYGSNSIPKYDYDLDKNHCGMI